MTTRAPTPEDIEKWDRWFAIETNNLAWTLAEDPARTPAQREEMLSAAHASAFHWSRIGSDLNKARADLLLGLVHGFLGNGPLATTHARRSFEYISAQESPDWEFALAHAVVANAAHAAREASLYAAQYALARSFGDAISDSGDKEIFERIFVQLPTPQDGAAAG
jgi:hypothetical protein